MLLPPKERQRRAKERLNAQKRRYEFHLPRAADWDFEKIKMPKSASDVMMIRAESYGYDIAKYFVFDVEPTNKYLDSKPGTFIERGKYRGYHLQTTPHEPLTFPIREGASSDVFFTSAVVIPSLVEQKPWGKWETWMGLSPAEMLSQRTGIRFCRGNVVVGGLGLGWFLAKVRERKQVDKITLVEQDPVLLEWFGAELCKKLDVGVICDDVWNVVGKMPAGTRYALDIWPHWFDAKHDYQLAQARKAGHDIWAWGSARGGSSR